jgi:hypothetical protein
MESFRELTVWQKSHELFLKIANDVELFPKNRVGWIISDQILRNGDEITSTTMHHSFRPPLPDLKSKSIKIACYSINFCDLRSNKFDPNLCAYLGKLFRPRS